MLKEHCDQCGTPHPVNAPGAIVLRRRDRELTVCSEECAFKMVKQWWSDEKHRVDFIAKRDGVGSREVAAAFEQALTPFPTMPPEDKSQTKWFIQRWTCKPPERKLSYDQQIERLLDAVELLHEAENDVKAGYVNGVTDDDVDRLFSAVAELAIMVADYVINSPAGRKK